MNNYVVNPYEFIHEEDARALNALKAIPGFDQLVKAFMKVFNEPSMKILNMSSKVRLSEEQCPRIYNLLIPICEKYGLILIEDAAQSFGASYKGKKCCAFGEIATTSFFPAKPLGCYGDGGAIFTNDDEVAELLRSLCVHGKGTFKYDNVRIGVNSRLDTIQAAILLPKLKAMIDHEIDNRQKVADTYNAAFEKDFTTPYVIPECQSIYAQYAILAKDTASRDKVLAHLTEKKIPNMIYYPTPQHALPVFAEEPVYGETFENANDYCARTLSLPMHPYMTAEDQKTVIDAVLEAL